MTLATTEARDRLGEEHGLPLDYLRLRALPLHAEARAWIERHEVVYVVEQNRDAQMLGLMRLELSAERIAKLRSVRHYNGLPIDARSVMDQGLMQERGRGTP